MNTGRISLRQDIIRFLLWARDAHPGIFVTYTEVCQRVHGYIRSPSLNSREVEAVRSAACGVRRLLMRDHQCGLITHPMFGMRASTDDADLLESQMVKVSQRLSSAQKMFIKTSDLIDTRKVPNTPKYKVLKEWYTSGLVPVAKAIRTTDFSSKLLPPKRDEATPTKQDVKISG